MSTYRKRPVNIEAWQFNVAATIGELTAFWPRWLLDAVVEGTVVARDEGLFISTLEGEMRVSDGDWIIKGIKGEIYPCKPDIFEATYDLVHP